METNSSPPQPASPAARGRARRWLRELLRDGERLSLPAAPPSPTPTEKPTRGREVGK
jgi:hypothetical protein